MDPEFQLANQENAIWRHWVDVQLEAIHWWLARFNKNWSDGNTVLRAFNDHTDQLSELGWRGDKIPF